jgi:uncharacterized membrane protein
LLAVLWLVNAVGGLTSLIFEFYEPGVLDEIRSGVKNGLAISPQFLLALVALFTVSLIMAFLSVRLRDRLNRALNIVVGLVYVAFSLILLLQKLESESVLAVGSVVGTIFAALVVWYAYKWPKS